MSRYGGNSYAGAGRRPPNIAGLTSLKVDNMGRRTTPEELYRLFERYGEIGDIHIPRDARSGESRGYAFIRFYSRRDADDAMYRLNDSTFNGRRIGVCMARYDRPNAVEGASRGGRGGGRRRSRSRSYSRSPRRRSRSRSRSRSASRSPRDDGSPARSRSRSSRGSRSHSRSKSRSPAK